MPLIAVILLAATTAACAASQGSTAPVAPSPVGSTAFVVNHAISSDPGSTITPVDLPSGAVERPIRTGTNLSTKAFAALAPSALAFGPGHENLYVTNFGANTVSELSGKRRTLTGVFKVGLEPDAVAISPGGRTAWVADFGSSSIVPVSLPSGRAGKPLIVGSEPRAVAVTPNGAEVLCASFGSSTVSIIDARTMRVLSTIAVGLEPTAIAITSNDSQALVADFGANALTVINLSTNQILRTVALPENPTDIVAAASGARARARNAPSALGQRAGTAAFYVTAGASIVPIIAPSDTTGRPFNIVYPVEALAISNGGTIADAALQGGAIAELDLATGRLGRLIHVGGIPTAIAVAPAETGD